MKLNKKLTVLIIDDDASIYEILTSFFNEAGHTPLFAQDEANAWKLFRDQKPDIIIVDIHLHNFSGIDFLKKIRAFDSITPIIITTNNPNMKTAVDAIHNGAHDYLVKPFQLEVLYSSIQQALKNVSLTQENKVLSELVSLHNISNMLSSTHNLDELLDVIFKFCTDTLNAHRAVIMLTNGCNNQLDIVRRKGTFPWKDTISPKIAKNAELISWVLDNNKALLIADEVANYDTNLNLSELKNKSALILLLKARDKNVGIVYIERSDNQPWFTNVDLNSMEILASQAGGAINNARLYSSLDQRISELSLLSSYSDKFLGIVDMQKVIAKLFLTVHQYFPIDMMGFLDIKKRFHTFHYWAKGNVSEDFVNNITNKTVDIYCEITKTKVMKKRIKPAIISIAPTDAGLSLDVMAFNHIIPLVWEDQNFGALYFGATNVPKEADEKKALLNSLVCQTRIALTNARLYSEMKENYIRTIKALAIAVDAKDTYTHGHSENVMNIAEAIALEMGISERKIGIIRDAGLLHDIGKIGIPGYILNKPGPLTNEEFNGVMKTHSTLGANIVRDVPFLQDLYSLILHHHEHHDGSGYPDGLSGDETPLGARILHVADAFEAMTSNRPYRDSLGRKEALRRLNASKNSQFDPNVVNAFMSMGVKKGWFSSEDIKNL